MAAARTEDRPQGKAREIIGIFVAGAAIFSAISLISMQAGMAKLMGPGGAATAVGLYSAAGFAAYVLVCAMGVVAVRCFQARRVHRGVGEILGGLGLLAATASLLHLPFAQRSVTLRGPGGLVGQWLGEIAASFIGSLGAALAAVVLMSVSLVVLTDVRVAEVAAAVAWAAAGTWRGVKAVGRGLSRMAVAMFPEKSAREDLNQDDDAIFAEDAMDSAAALDMDMDMDMGGSDDSLGAGDADVTVEPELIIHPPVQAQVALPSESLATPSDVPIDPVAAHMAHMADLVGEVAAVECATVAQLEALHKDPTLQTLQGIGVDALVGQSALSVPSSLPPIFAGTEPQDGKTEPNVIPMSIKQVAGAAPVIIEPVVPRIKADDKAPKKKSLVPSFIRLSQGAFALPGTDLLQYKPPQNGEVDKASLHDMAGRVKQAMANYGVKGEVTAINLGPVVTMYEFQPAAGTRVGKIIGLEVDLAMALEAQAVRIAPIAGKSVVGVEVPNQNREMVYLKEILEDPSFVGGGGKLQIGLGKDIKGAAVSVNLAKMPHLLVAGTTGSGKSVTVNGMIASILCNATPEEVRFIMVDPKMLELSIYQDIPHLLLPVVTDPKKANLALRWAVDEMERRYELLSKVGVRDIIGYNEKVAALLAKNAEARAAAVAAPMAESPSKRARRLKVVITDAEGNDREVEVDAESGPSAMEAMPQAELQEAESARAAAAQAAREEAPPAPTKLPYIVIVIDEFADLMMVAPKDVETSVARLAQKARAAGLHLILATQRPSVDVITGLIKANFPSRIALQVVSKIDARTIMDQPGAETLLGNGDMLFSDRGMKLRRIHGAFLSDDEVHRLVAFLKTQAKPVYDMEILKPRDEDGEGASADDYHDELYDQAVAIVCETRQASVSFIQRRLQIGYNRSARMVEQMEREGIVGAPNGIKPREILAPVGGYLQAAP